MRGISFSVAFSTAAGLAIPSARADRPSGWIARATPGAAWIADGAASCSTDGATMAGGFSLGRQVVPGLIAGLATTIAMSSVGHDAPCTDEPMTSHLALTSIVGPSLDWYPSERGFHAGLTLGYAELAVGRDIGRGAGGTAAIGWDWITGERDSTFSRTGVQLQVTIMRPRLYGVAHPTTMPALLATFGFD